MAQSASSSAGSQPVPGRSGWMPRDEERLGPIDVADATHDRLIHQQVADAPLAPRDLVDHPVGLRTPTDRVGSEPGKDLACEPTGGSIEHAVGPLRSTVTYSSRSLVGLGLEAHPDLADRVGRLVGSLHPVLAEEPEMDVADLAGRPLVEEVLAERLDSFEHGAVDPVGVRAKRPCGLDTRMVRPARSRPWSRAMRWMVWPSGMGPRMPVDDRPCVRSTVASGSSEWDQIRPVAAATVARDGHPRGDHGAVGARSRRRAVVDVRELRAVPAALSDVPGHAARRSTRRAAASMRCGRSTAGRLPIDDSSSTSWRPACSAAGASRPARAGCSSVH